MPALVPNEAMVSAAQKGIEVADSKGLGLSDSLRGRARMMAAGDELSPSQVYRLQAFFSEYTDQRPEDDALDGSDWHTMWQLHGGDSGKAWTAARVKELRASTMLSEEDLPRDANGQVVVKEVFLSAKPVVEEDAEGLIWKPIIHEGVWKGPNGTPLRVVAGKSSAPEKEIGLQDLVESFEDNAVQHVTIPLTHEDRPEENTGYVKKVKIALVDGVKTLLGGHDFTEPDIKGKVVRGTIPNSSGGIRINHERRESDGTVKKYASALIHNSLTPRPWLSRLQPFGVTASEKDNPYVVEALEFSEPLEVEPPSTTPSPTTTTPSTSSSSTTLPDVKPDSASQGDEVPAIELNADEKKELSEILGEDFAVHVALAERESGYEAEVTRLAEKGLNKPQAVAVAVGKFRKTEPTPTPTPPEPINLAELPEFKKLSDDLARQRADNDQLLADKRKREADDYVGWLSDTVGLSEEAGCVGFLKEVREVLLSEEGDAVILLSEDGADAPKPYTASAMLRRVLSKLPTDEKTGRLKVTLSEQATDPFRQSHQQRPPLNDGDKVELSEEEFAKQQDAVYEQMWGTKPVTAAPAASTNGNDKQE